MTNDPEWLCAFRSWSYRPESPQFPSRHEELEAEEIFKAGWDAAKPVEASLQEAVWLRTIVEMVIEERDTWRWRVIGGHRPQCRHPQLHDATSTIRNPWKENSHS